LVGDGETRSLVGDGGQKPGFTEISGFPQQSPRRNPVSGERRDRSFGEFLGRDAIAALSPKGIVFWEWGETR
jgi:hypothetical protein